MVHLPTKRLEWIPFCLFWLGGLWTLYYEFFIVLSSYHDKWNDIVTIHFAVATFLALQIYTNMFQIITTAVSAKQLSLPEGPPSPGWKYCEKCKMNTPPRCHHCPSCDICVLKRDHHCLFAGYCIGYNNHRYIICLAFYATIAGLYGNIYNWDFFMDVKGGFAWSTIPGFFAPHVGLVFGYYTLYEFFITVTTSVGVFVTVFFIWLFYSQVVQLVNGQVMYERKKGIFDYNLGLSNSLNEIFGSAGLLVFLCPLIPTKLPGDGSSFPMCSDKSE